MMFWSEEVSLAFHFYMTNLMMLEWVPANTKLAWELQDLTMGEFDDWHCFYEKDGRCYMGFPLGVFMESRGLMPDVTSDSTQGQEDSLVVDI